MKKRGKKLIDKKFQHKAAFSVIGVSIIISTLLIGIIGVNALYNNSKLAENVLGLEKVIEDEHNIVEAFLEYSKQVGSTDISLFGKKISVDHNKSLLTIKTHIGFIGEVIGRNRMLIIIMIGILLIQGIVLYLYLIRLTHRISGPVYVMNQYINEILQDRDPKIRPLREKDELKEFYDNFVAMIHKLRSGE